MQYFFKNILSFFFVGSIVEYWIQVKIQTYPDARTYARTHIRAHAYIFELTIDDDDSGKLHFLTTDDDFKKKLKIFFSIVVAY